MKPNASPYRKSAAWDTAYAALRTLLDEEGLNSVEQVFLQIAGQRRKENWQKQRNVIPSRSPHVCFYRLVGKRCQGDECNSPHIIPGADHCSEWRKDGHAAIIASQPYELSLSSLRKMVALCDENNLNVFVRAWESWHFPGASMLVEYRHRASDPKMR